MTTPREIVDLVRSPNIDVDDAVELVNQFAAVKASEAAQLATSAAYDRCIEIMRKGKQENTRMIGPNAWKLLKALEAMPMNVGAAIAMEDDTRSDIVSELLDAGYAVEVGGVLRCTLSGKAFVRQESNLRDDNTDIT